MSLFRAILGKKKRVGLALGAGGARGLSHIAFLKVFDELGIRPHIIAGTSIGAAIGALYASGMPGAEIENRLAGMKLLQMSRLADISISPRSRFGLMKGKRLMEFLKRLIGSREFHDLEIPLCVIATDYWNRNEVVLQSGSVADAVRASISIPGILEPVLMDGRVLIDGGAANPLPYDVIRNRCDIVVAIDVLGEKVPAAGIHEKPNIFECIFNTFQIMEASLLESKMALSRPDIYIKPKLTNIRVLEFNRAKEIILSVQSDGERLKKLLSDKLS